MIYDRVEVHRNFNYICHRDEYTYWLWNTVPEEHLEEARQGYKGLIFKRPESYDINDWTFQDFLIDFLLAEEEAYGYKWDILAKKWDDDLTDWKEWFKDNSKAYKVKRKGY